MNVFSMVSSIMFLSVVMVLCIVWMVRSGRVQPQALRDASKRIDDLEETVAATRQRIAVLERIVTDRGAGLSDEIERLRHQA